ncbi:peptidyl-prolyl cis-trans isomerase [Parasphingopyxis sp.]|uniref:peptidyl-prolyl cis-trans isomerase n=1 Tax=Parasphingopyxis sp. TaxID=1920299 RepID=UPI0026251737|nr:peptidyl-prolyl cis-trans isomerase [Parasphingopyxis sp.]
MISFFRNLFASKLGLLFAMAFVALIAAAFALADISAPGGGGTGFLSRGGTTVATVDGVEVNDERIAQLVTRALQNAREQQPGLDMAALIEGGGLDETISQYMEGEALSAFARDYGLLISKRLIDATIAEIPAFQGLTGTFDEPTFRQVLAQQGLTEDEVRLDLERQTLISILLGPVAANAQVPAAIARPYAGLLLEERSGQVASIPSSTVPQGNPPTTEELQTFYDANLQRYTLPERRSVRYAIFSLDDVDIPTPTDEQVREYYAANSDTYGGSETRTFQQIILADQVDARAFYQAVDGGADFVEQAIDRGFTAPSTQVSGVTLESFENSTSEEIAAAAFGASEGTLLQPIRSGLGWHVIRIADIVNRDATPLGAVRPEIVRTLTEQFGNEALAQLYLDMENAIEDGASFEEVADDKGLTIVATPLVSPNGLAPQQPDFRPTADLAPVLEMAFTLDDDEDAVLVPVIVDERYAMVDVTEIARSAPQPLNTIRNFVTRDFIADRAARRAGAIAREIAAKVNNGMPLSQAMAEADIDLPPPQPARATRQAISQAGVNVPEPVRLLFRMAAETAKLVRLPRDQGWYVVVLDEIQSDPEAITPEIVEATRRQFATVTADEYAEQFINAVLADYPIERNEEAIEALAERLVTGRSN